MEIVALLKNEHCDISSFFLTNVSKAKTDSLHVVQSGGESMSCILESKFELRKRTNFPINNATPLSDLLFMELKINYQFGIAFILMAHRLQRN